MPRNTPTPRTEKLVVAFLRIVVAWSLLCAAGCYFIDFLPLFLGNWLQRYGGYLTPAVSFALSISILYSKSAIELAASYVDRFAAPLVNRIIREVSAASTQSPQFLTIPEVVSCAFIATAVVAADILLSLRYGLLSCPPLFDGLGYMMDSLRVYLGISQAASLFTGYGYSAYGPCAWGWDALIIASYHLFGVGVWQASTARFWPTLVFLINIAWVMKRRTGSVQTWAIVIVSALIPILSPCIRALVWNKVLGDSVNGYTWYMDDLRPDFLNSALLMSSVCLAIETARKPSTAAFVLSGLAAGLALFVKVSAAPGTGIVFALAMICAVWLGQKRISSSLAMVLTATLTFLLFAWVWQINGGYGWMETYLEAAFQHPELWSTQNYSPLHSASLYVQMMWCELGPAESIAAAASIIFIAFQVFRRKLQPFEELPLCYAFIGAVFFVSLCFVKSLNYFLGYTAFMLFWVAAVSLISERLITRVKHLVIGTGSAAYCTATVLAAVLAFNHPSVSTQDGRFALSAAKSISEYLGNHFSSQDTILCESFYGSPTMYSEQAQISPDTGKQTKRKYPYCRPIQEEDREHDLVSILGRASAAIVFEEPASQCAHCPGYSPQIYWSKFDRVKQIVRDPDSGFIKVATYPIPVEIPEGSMQSRRIFLNLNLYVHPSHLSSNSSSKTTRL